MKKHFSENWIKNEVIDISEKEICGNVSVHSHEFYELEIILDGSGYYYVDGNRYDVKTGAMFFMSPTSFHRLELAENTRLINVMFDANDYNFDILYEIFCDVSYIYLMLSKDDLDFIRYLINDIKTHLEEVKAYEKYIFTIENAILMKIAYISKKLSKSNKITPIQKSILYIHNNFKSNISVRDVAEITHYSITYFCTIFKNYTEKTFTEYLNELRFSHAKKLLRYTSYNVTEVCMECGFKDYSHFMALFKKNFGITPLQYRKKYLKK